MTQVKINKIIRFALVGLVNTALDLAVLNLLVFLFGASDPFVFSIYKGISFCCALVNSYYMNKYFTFTHSNTNQKTFYVFVFFSLIGFVVNVLTSSFAFYLLSLNSGFIPHSLVITVSGLVGTFFGLTFNYINYSFFVFK